MLSVWGVVLGRVGFSQSIVADNAATAVQVTDRLSSKKQRPITPT
jgi:hypothetical protein